MAHYKIKAADALILCPFDNTHLIRQSRMQYHLIDCKKNFPGQKYEVCPFNARHYVKKPELQHHIDTCPDKALIEKDLFYGQNQRGGTYFQGDCSVPDYSDKVVAYNDGEDWESECDPVAKTYKWGEKLDDHFQDQQSYGYQTADYYSSQQETQRLPHGMPHVLRTLNGTHPNRQSDSQSQRLPNSVPLTQRPQPTVVAGGIARGRGVATLLNQAPPAVGRVAQQQVSEPEPFLKPAPHGRGRGKRSKVNGNGVLSSMGPTGYSDDDATSTSSNSSERSESSRSSRGASRRINVDGVGINGKPTFKPEQITRTNQPLLTPAQPKSQHHPQYVKPTVTEPSLSYAQQAAAPSPTFPRAHPPTTAQQAPAPSPHQPQGVRPLFGLLGMGRGAGRGFNPSAQPAFIIPNVNKDSSSGQDDTKKQIRKCEKKIREIEALEAKRSQGNDLNVDEETKIIGKKDLLRQLRELHLNL